jgi:hemerythrin-like domain-containing protein
MADVFAVLSTDHEEVRQMLAQLENPAGTVGESYLAGRKKLAERLVIESSRHEAAEEQYFWPAVRDRVPDGGALADHAIGQEQEAKQVLAELDRLEASDPRFDEVIGKFIPAAREHIAFEERQVWPLLRVSLSEADAAELGDKLMAAKKAAPTRPHPNMPSAPGALKAAGPVVAASDKVRDAATGRGRQ